MNEKINDILPFLLPLIATTSISIFIVYKYKLSIKLWGKLDGKIKKEYMSVTYYCATISLLILAYILCGLLGASNTVAKIVSFGLLGLILPFSPTQYINSQKNSK